MMLLRNNVWLYVELSLCGTALLSCMIVLPKLFAEMDELNEFVFNSVQEFKDDVDAAWNELMDIQAYRQKRAQLYEPPPEKEACMCDKMPICNMSGPAGAMGTPGEDGSESLVVI
jgi:hypothetical protein